jgi:hypothetical protein
MIEPTVDRHDDRLVFTWRSIALTIELSRFQESSRETRVDLLAKLQDGVIACLSLDLMNFSLRAQLAGHLQKRLGKSLGISWDSILETLTVLSLAELRKGEPVESLEPMDGDQPASSFLLEPLILEAHPNVIYAPGGSGKSYVALFAGLLASCGESVDLLRCNSNPRRVLYLDWELSVHDQRARVKMIREGHRELGGTAPFYRRCLRPLADSIPELQRIVKGEGYNLLIVDSLAPAVGADELEKAGPAIRFFTALRTLNIPSLIVGHTPKQSDGERTIYGSVFFTNLARNVWEIRTNCRDSRLTRMGLFHTKYNICGRQNPIGLDLIIDEDKGSAVFKPFEITDESKRPSLVSRMLALMKRDQFRTWDIEDLAKEMDSKKDSIRRTLQRHKDLFIEQPTGWVAA